MTSLSNGDVLVYNGTSTKFVNKAPVTSGTARTPLRSDALGFVSSSALQYNVNFGTNILSSLSSAVQSSDVVTKAQVDGQTIDPSAGIGSLTLKVLYDQDTEFTPNVVITTSSSMGALEIAGSEDFKVSSNQGFLLASSVSDDKFTKSIYKHGLTLSANQTDTSAFSPYLQCFIL
jgi:hypothetical protein